jgi:large subunit ribosomal protein L15
MPLTRRLPKRGFNNARFRVAYQIVGLDDLARVQGSEVTVESLFAAGLVRQRGGPVKLLANGDVAQAYTVRGLKVSGAAKERVVAAGGRVEE